MHFALGCISHVQYNGIPNYHIAPCHLVVEWSLNILPTPTFCIQTLRNLVLCNQILQLDLWNYLLIVKIKN
jgi:hypothetical protein